MQFPGVHAARLLLGLAVLFASTARAGTDLKILIDSDHNTATGCRVITATGNFDGVDQIVTTSFDGTVTAVTRQQCVDPATATFGPAVNVDGSGWAVGSAGGTLLIETHLGAAAAGPMRLGFVISSGSLLDTVLGQQNGDPIVFPVEYTGHGRRHVVMPDAGRIITLDGDGGDWRGLAPLVPDAAGIGTPALQFLNIYAFDSPSDVFFRFDVQANPNAPRANSDSYTTLRGSTLTVPAPGVLGNDSDPNGKPLTAVLVSGPQHGTLTLSANGGFTYANDGSPAAMDSFRYKASNGTDLSNAAISALIIISGVAPVITSPNHVTFTVGTPGTFTVTRTGNPTPGLGETGALPGGVTFNPSTGILSGVPAAGTGGTYAIQFTASNVVGTNSQNFTLTVNEAPAFSSANSAQLHAGSLANFMVTTSGFPRPSIGRTGALPTGVTFTDNGNGTATIGGTPAGGSGGTYVLTLMASNLLGSVNQTFTITVCNNLVVTNPATATGTAGSPFSQTFTQTGAIGGATFTTASALPAGLSLSAGGTLSGTPSKTGTFPVVVMVTDGNGCTGSGTTYNLVISCPAITVTNPGVTSGTAGAAFSQTFTESGGFGATTFSTASALPAGLTLSPAGVLAGTPTHTGTFPIVVTATDSAGCTGSGSTYTLIIGCQTITVTNPLIGSATVNAPFSQMFSQTGAIGGATFTTASVLPPGLVLAPNGLLAGTPAVPGLFPIVVTVTDGNGCTGTGSSYDLFIACQTISVNRPANTTGTVNAAFSEQFTQTGGAGTTTFSTASALPTGFTLNPNTGVLAGTTVQSGTFAIVVTATDSNGCTGSATYNLVINCQTITVTNPANNLGTVAVPFSEQFTQTGALGGATFSTASALPTGLTLSNAGLLSGTPAQAGTFNITVTVTDGNGCTAGGATYSLVISCYPITVTNPANSIGAPGVPFSEQFTQSGGSGTVNFTTASTLPTGLTLALNGTLSGTTIQTGAFPIVVTATDANGCTGTSATYTLTINCQTITVTNPATTTGTAGTAFSATFTATGIVGTVTWSETGTLPTGITLNSATGALSGTTTQSGSFPITVKATDTNGCFGTSSYTLTISCQTVTVSNPGVTSGTISSPFSQTFTAIGILGTATWSETGTLPAGITLNSASGVLSGTPTQTGTFPITVKATDTNNCFGTGATYTLSIAPVANGDSYGNLVDNTQAAVTGGLTSSPATPFVGLTGKLIDNDAPAGGVSATAGTFATSAGGSVTIQTDGTFVYTPPLNSAAPAITSDSFTYTVSSNTGGTSPVMSAAATVSLTLANRVWYVKNNGSAGSGQSQGPFNTLAAAGAASTAGDIIFVYNGDGTNSGQNAGISLLNGQQLWGEAAALVVNAQTLVSAGSRPTIGNSGGAGVTVASSTANGDRTNVVIKGLAVAGTAHAVDISSANATSLSVTVDNVQVNSAGNHGIRISGGSSLTSTVTVQNSAVLSATQNGIDAQQTVAGNLVLSINNDSVTATGTGINVNGAGSTSTTITNFANNAVSGNTGGSGIVVSTATFDATPGGTFQTVSGGTTVVGASGNGVGASGMVLTNVSGDLSFTDLDIFADAGSGLVASGLTAYTGSAGFQIAVGAGVATSTAIGGPAVNLTTVSSNLPFSSISSSNSAATGVNLDTVTGTFSAGSGSSITNATGTDFNINAGNASVTYSGTISDNTGRVVSVTGTTGGTKSFTGAITNSGGTGIFLSSNTGATINFSGTIILSTGASDAFTATGGGTVSASDPNSTIATTTGRAVNVQNTTIGANNLVFKSINVTGSAGSPTNGILLSTTGAGTLKVLGDGSTNTCKSGTTTCSGGTIQSTGGDGVSITSGKVDLSLMWIKNCANSGIKGTTVSGFKLTDLLIQNNTNATGEQAGILVNDLSDAAALVTRAEVSGSTEDNVRIHNSATTGAITFSSCTIKDNSVASGNDGIFFQTNTTGNLTGTVQNSTFSGNRTIALAADSGDGSTVSASFLNNMITAGSPNTGNQGIQVSRASTSTLTFNVSGNTVNGMSSTLINVFSGSGPGTGTGDVKNNICTGTGVGGNQFGIRVFNSGTAVVGQGTLNVNVANNTVSAIDNAYAIFGESSNSSGSGGLLKMAVTNNTANVAAGGTALDAIRVQARNTSTVCAAISGNSSLGGGLGFYGLQIRQANTAVFNLEGLTLGSQTDPVVPAFLATQNPSVLTIGTLVGVSSGPINGVAVGSCGITP